jgi:hypothetical protein
MLEGLFADEEVDVLRRPGVSPGSHRQATDQNMPHAQLGEPCRRHAHGLQNAWGHRVVEQGNIVRW